MAVQARNLSKTFGTGDSAVTALNRVSVDFPRGEFTAIMGPSGSGKSTLLHMLSTLDSPDSSAEASLIIAGQELLGQKDRFLSDFRSRHIGFIFQSFNLIPTLTAEQNIELPLGLSGTDMDVRWKSQLIEALGLAERIAHRPAQLSGGQQQRVAIARALLPRPSVIFADEPTGNLDTQSGQEVLNLLREASDRQGQTTLMVTHDPVAASFANSVLLFKDGAIAGRIENPTRSSVLDSMAQLGA